jgi:hypothetical protein
VGMMGPADAARIIVRAGLFQPGSDGHVHQLNYLLPDGPDGVIDFRSNAADQLLNLVYS